MALDADTRRRAARALWAWSGMKQEDFATAAGIGYDRLRAALNDDKKAPPSTDELIQMAAAAGVPEYFAVDGFRPPLYARVAALEHQQSLILETVDASRTAAAEAFAEQAGKVAEHTRAIEELRAADRRRRRMGEPDR